jgi:thiol-disulfide isomerase/thioredoxin
MTSRISRKTWLIVAIAVIVVAVVVGIALSRNSSSRSEGLNFTVPITTWNETSLYAFEGSPLVINFWTTGCPYCLRQLPYLESVAQQSEGEVRVVAVNVGESTSRILSSLRSIFDHEPAMAIALDTNARSFVTYCRNLGNPQGSIPFTLFIDGEGMVRYRRIGAFASEDDLWNALEDVLGITIP